MAWAYCSDPGLPTAQGKEMQGKDHSNLSSTGRGSGGSETNSLALKRPVRTLIPGHGGSSETTLIDQALPGSRGKGRRVGFGTVVLKITKYPRLMEEQVDQSLHQVAAMQYIPLP